MVRLAGKTGTRYEVVLEDLDTMEKLAPEALGSAMPAARRPEGPCASYRDCLLQARDLLSRGDCAAAMPLIQHAADKAPGLPDAYFYRAVVHKRTGRHAAARRDFRRSVLLAPGFRTYDDGSGMPAGAEAPCRTLPPGPGGDKRPVELPGGPKD